MPTTSAGSPLRAGARRSTTACAASSISASRGRSPASRAHPTEVEVVAVSLFGHYDPEVGRAFDDRLQAAADVAPCSRPATSRRSRRAPSGSQTAVAAVADSEQRRRSRDPLLRRQGPHRHRLGAAARGGRCARRDSWRPTTPRADAKVMPLFDGWIEASADDAERELRQRLAQAPAATMLAVIGWLREHAGGAAGYLREAGLELTHSSRGCTPASSQTDQRPPRERARPADTA